MNFFKSVALFLIVVNLTGCAGRAANPVMVHQISDEQKSCSILKREMSSIELSIQQLIPQTDKTSKNVAFGIAGLFIWPFWLCMDLSSAEKEEINAYRMRYDHLMNIYNAKGCRA
jgi:hypothetical protein